ncbi:MAG: hypothetical protein AAB347_09640 [Bacteroidota bacterium]
MNKMRTIHAQFFQILNDLFVKKTYRFSFVLFFLWLSYTDVSFGLIQGMVLKPALTPGNAVDPDGDGYVSQKTNGVLLGFTTPPGNDVSQSEIPYVDMQKLDPVAGLLMGPNGSFSYIIGIDAAGHGAILGYSESPLCSHSCAHRAHNSPFFSSHCTKLIKT